MHKKAESLMETGAYEEAIPLFEQLLRSDPRDEKAIAGLKSAREKVIDSKLIQVRLSRIAENNQNAVDILAGLVALENKWQTYPAGKVAFTQDEESGYAFDFVAKTIVKALREAKPLLAQYTANKYALIFGTSQQKQFNSVQLQIKEAGLNQCKQLSTPVDRTKPYFLQFVKKLCSVWGDSGPATSSSADPKAKGLFRDVDTGVRIEGIPQGFEGQFASDLQAALKSTPWFHPSGEAGTVRVNLSGSYKKTRDRDPIRQVHEYTVRVPYIAYEKVQKSREVPYQTTQLNCYSGTCTNTPVTQYRTEYYEESQPVTRYRNDPRTQAYEAWKYRQVLKIIVEGQVDLGASHTLISVSERTEKEAIQHDWNMPDIGLFPKPLDLPDPTDWLKRQSAATAQQFETKISETWNALYCADHLSDDLPKNDANSKKVLALSGDQVHQCLRLAKKKPPEFVNRWYQAHFGINAAQANEILGLQDF